MIAVSSLLTLSACKQPTNNTDNTSVKTKTVKFKEGETPKYFIRYNKSKENYLKSLTGKALEMVTKEGEKVTLNKARQVQDVSNSVELTEAQKLKIKQHAYATEQNHAADILLANKKKFSRSGFIYSKNDFCKSNNL